MDLSKPGPSRRHVSSTHPSSSTPMYSDNYINFNSDEFGLGDPHPQPLSQVQPPPRPPSIPQTSQNSQQFSNFNSPFYQPPPNTNFSDNFGAPPSWQQQQSPQQQQQQQPGFQMPQMSMNQQLFMAAGQQFFSSPKIDELSNTIVGKGKSWLDMNVKQYFAVNTNYAVKKLLLIFLPFLHKDWSIRCHENSNEPLTPTQEPNLPDLYIPLMAFITYILLSGYILGLKNQFAPDQLGIYASSAMGWLLLEVMLIMIAKYAMNLAGSLGFFHIVAFGGYKFVYIDALLLVSLMLGHFGYKIFFIYASLSLGYFLLRALSKNLQSPNLSQSSYQTSSYESSTENPRMAYYLVMFVAILQPLVMYFLTNSLADNSMPPSIIPPSD